MKKDSNRGDYIKLIQRKAMSLGIRDDFIFVLL